MRRMTAGMLCAFVAMAADFTITPVPGTRFPLEVNKTGLMSGKVHVFTFDRYSGELHYDEAAPERSTVTFTVENRSLACHDTWVDEKDRQKIVRVAHEAMDTEHHPRMTFRSEKVVKRDDGGFDATGPLTIKGIARPMNPSQKIARPSVARSNFSQRVSPSRQLS